MHQHGKPEARGLRMFAVGLGVFIAAGLSLNPDVYSFRNHAPTLVFASSIDPSCQVMVDANNKALQTPYRAYSTVSGSAFGGMTMNVEEIFVENTMYSRVEGKWSASSFSAQELKDLEKGNQDNSKKASCQHLRDESVKGEIAAVYSSHSENEHGKNDQMAWISKSNGLLLRSEVDTTTVKGAKGHISLRYEYSNIQKPKL